MVARGYLAGHCLARIPIRKKTSLRSTTSRRQKENDRLPLPIITPTTKATVGHDEEDISKEQIIERGIVEVKKGIIKFCKTIR